MKQHFKVGELVVICSSNNAKYNGTIVKILSYIRGKGICTITKKALCEHGYYLDIEPVNGTPIWDQSALRKYYPPSTQTFAEIMEGLKSPVKT